jgi:hypothetical protein
VKRWFVSSAFLLTAILAMVGLAPSQQTLRGPIQPLPFSHQQHAGALSLDCKMCHVNPDPGELMTYPATATCMTCHSSIKTDSPHIQELAKAAAEDRSINWVRVYEVPGFVYFSHRTHLATGATCQKCHGEVQTRERVFVDGDITMSGCMNCHVENSAPIDCNFCHDQI